MLDNLLSRLETRIFIDDVSHISDIKVQELQQNNIVTQSKR